MTTFATKVLLAVSLLSLAALRTAAAADIIDTSDPAVVLAMVKAYGDAMADKNTDGDPIITGTMDSKAYVIFFEGCTSGKACQSLRFYSRWNDSPLTLEQINDYNGRGNFARATVKDRAVALQMDISLVGGATAANFNDTIDWFKSQLAGFRQQYAEKAPG